jgi:guanosine-3',5'-bis(diphosphate) 3'-pyrophosphohydrolase
MHMIDRVVENYTVPQEYGGAMGGLLMLVREYMDQDEIDQVLRAYHLAQETCHGVTGRRPLPPLEHALAVTTILAKTMHVDAIGISAGLVFEAMR